MIGFDSDIKPLFREFDRDEMEWVFDLWNHEDVTENAEGILERVVDGTMPCDAPWAEETIAMFRTWLEAGCPE